MPSSNSSLYRRSDSLSSNSLKDVLKDKGNNNTSATGSDLSYTDGAPQGPIPFDKVILHKIAFAVWQAAFYLQKPRKVVIIIFLWNFYWDRSVSFLGFMNNWNGILQVSTQMQSLGMPGASNRTEPNNQNIKPVLFIYLFIIFFPKKKLNLIELLHKISGVRKA